MQTLSLLPAQIQNRVGLLQQQLPTSNPTYPPYPTDTYDNFQEFAVGTDPTNPSSGNPIQINPPRRLPVGISPLASNTVTFSALFHQNLSTAYWLQYELQYKTNLMTPGWASEYLGIPHVLPSDPVSYIELSTNVPTTPDPNKFYRLRATINTY